MFADCAEYPTQVEQLRTIQVQCRHRCSAGSSAPYDYQEILAPYKMPFPMLAAWVKEWHKAPSLRVRSAGFSVFVGIAPWTCPREVVQPCLTPSPTRNNVLTMEGRIGEIGREATILTKPSRPRPYLTA
jgi:hypothetical protein